MSIFRPLALALALGALTAAAAPAQQPPQKGFPPKGFPPPGKMPPPPLHMLIQQKSVRDELKITQKQLPPLRELVMKAMQSMKALFGQPREQAFEKMQEIMKENDQAILAALQPKQAQRLKEIALQQRGVAAFADPKIAEELKLTTEQQQQIQDVLEAGGKQIQKLFQGGRPPAPQVMQAKMAEMNKSGMTKVQKVLTDEQKSQWKQMTGKPFRGVLPMMPGFGPPGFGPPPGGGPPGAGSPRSGAFLHRPDAMREVALAFSPFDRAGR